MTSTRMFQALDLCLECKGCKGECPANVDMAKLKYEFLARYYERHSVPLRSRLFGDVARWNQLASHFPSLYNATLRNGLLRQMMEEFLGIDRRRPLQLLVRERFSQWFARHRQVGQAFLPVNDGRGNPDNRPALGLFVDTFTEYHCPEVGKAAVEVLEAFGYRVVLLETRCCGRPLISKGLLDRALENARANLVLLRDTVERGIPIIGLEPSCLLTFRDEYPELLPGPEADRLAKNSFLFEEFLDPDRQHPSRPIWPSQPILPRRALFHGHCHMKALVGSEPSLRLLRSIPGLDVTEVDSGCCGMAGSFGFEKEHYDISLAIAEQRLAPAVRALPPDGLVIASGVSCRQQIAHLTAREPLHPAEVLQQTLTGF